ncbi:unnamed protein product [Rotaria sordida]|uniref:Poly [ADP-ribose] polymerase n=1 Tax=Rotaria sordida TaxID=392033 RepID=A0A815S0W8_9BILA|nr:unnamed protein product [Rotaria sordida]CAF1483913.1 unnamed protein product [Rotaria sordida]
MSLENDENRLKKCLEEIIEIIEKTNVEQSSYTNSRDKVDSNKQMMENLTIRINNKLKSLLDLLSLRYREYFLDFFSNYNYNYSKGIFNETIKTYILKNLSHDLYAIIDSFDAFQASFDGNLLLVKNFVEKHPKYKDKSGIWDTTLLYSSSRNNHLNIVKYLIEQGKCYVNVQNRKYNQNLSRDSRISPTSGSTALHAACFYGHIDIVRYLIDNEANYFIKNDAQETPIYNGLLRNNIKEFFQDFLIFNYSNSNINIPESTILETNQLIFDSIWEYKSIYSDQWIIFDDNQSNQLQQSFYVQLQKNFNPDLIMKIDNNLYNISLIQFLCFQKSNSLNNEYLWIRCRGSSIANFNFYSKWQIMFDKHISIKSNKSVSLEVFYIKNNSNDHIQIKLNHWFYLNNYINQQLDDALNYRRKYLNIYLPFINNDLFQFNLKTFSFSNHENTINGFIRWIPTYISSDNQTIIDNFQPLTNIKILPLFRTYSAATFSNNDHIHQSTTTVTNQYSEINNNGKENASMVVRFGDLIKDTSDVIVVCWSSKYLLEIIYECGGSSVRTAINNQLEKKLKNSLTSVKSDGDIKSKRIYFIHWIPESDIDLVKKSLEILISIAMQRAHDDNYKSIAFPAIGCGDYQYPVQIVAQTMVNKAHQEQILHKISVSFIIQSTKKDVFHHFDKQINVLNQSTSTGFVSKIVQNGLIQIEKGDITKQKVDVIVISSSSDYLRQIVIMEGGEEVYGAYEKENKTNPDCLLISTPPGNLPCKRIFFLKWVPDENENLLRQSIVDFIWNVIQNVLAYKFDSIAFPPIGCAHSNISTSIIIQTLINQLIYQIKNRNLSLTVKFIILPDQDEIYQEFHQELLKTEQDIEPTNDDKVPSTWELAAGNSFRFIVSFKLDEYKTIADEFYRAMKGKIKRIIQIERIQNERWYFQYLAHKKDFFKRLNKNTEKRLYHGCPSNAVDSIIADCFNRSFAGLNGTSYGIGVYFSSDATYSNQFAKPNSNGERSMFIARVLIGKTILGNPSMKTRPPGFDTTTDGNHIFVTYHDAQAYAEYLITYK